MGQAFFTLGLGVGSMTIFGSYIDKSRSLTGEALYIVLLDTVVALAAGLIIFPACFAFGVNPGSGPGLVFVTLPNIFNSMPFGRFWGSLFFVFMSFAALSTVIAVFENIVSYCMDVWGWTRKKAFTVNCIAMFLLSLPCTLGFNVLSGFQPFGEGSSVLDLEDFLLSNNLLPFGALLFLSFCCHRWGWGWNNFIAETDQGRSWAPHWLKLYLQYILPCVRWSLFFHSRTCSKFMIRGKKRLNSFCAASHQSKVFEGERGLEEGTFVSLFPLPGLHNLPASLTT